MQAVKDAVGKVTGRSSRHEEEGLAGGHRDVHGTTGYTGGVAGGPAYGGTEVRGGQGRRAGGRASGMLARRRWRRRRWSARRVSRASAPTFSSAAVVRSPSPSALFFVCLQGAAYTERAEGYAEVPVVQQVRGGSW